MGIVNKAKAAAGTAAVVVGSVTGQPSPTAQLGQQADVRNRQRQSTSLSEATRTKGRPTTSGKR